MLTAVPPPVSQTKTTSPFYAVVSTGTRDRAITQSHLEPVLSCFHRRGRSFTHANDTSSVLCLADNLANGLLDLVQGIGVTIPRRRNTKDILDPEFLEVVDLFGKRGLDVSMYLGEKVLEITPSIFNFMAVGSRADITSRHGVLEQPFRPDPFVLRGQSLALGTPQLYSVAATVDELGGHLFQATVLTRPSSHLP